MAPLLDSRNVAKSAQYFYIMLRISLTLAVPFSKVKENHKTWLKSVIDFDFKDTDLHDTSFGYEAKLSTSFLKEIRQREEVLCVIPLDEPPEYPPPKLKFY